MTYEEAYASIAAGKPVKASDITHSEIAIAKAPRTIVNLFAGTERGNALEGKLLRRAEKIVLLEGH